MKLVKTQPRYKCDYCSKVGIKIAIANHEHLCWLNPDRHCDLCNNTGYSVFDAETGEKEECYYCKQFKPDIEEYAKKVYALHPYLKKFSPE